MREYKGAVVPWVAIWSEEVPNPDDHPLWLDPRGRVRYREERPDDRDAQGVLWVRNILAPGKGVPMFKQVHADRQRNSMITPRCQVCGLRMEGHAFLLQEEMLRRFPKQGYITTGTPPVCDSCIPIAYKLCPQLNRQPLLRVVATTIGMWGYIGDVANDDGSWTRQRQVAVNDPRIGLLLAKQVLVAITEWTEVSWSPETPSTSTAMLTQP